jgi:hypothetical protein
MSFTLIRGQLSEKWQNLLDIEVEELHKEIDGLKKENAKYREALKEIIKR